MIPETNTVLGAEDDLPGPDPVAVPVQKGAVAGMRILDGEVAFAGHLYAGMYTGYGIMIQYKIAFICPPDSFPVGFHVAMIHCNFVLNR